ncbi:MAG: glycosyltransferase [Pseudomonadota bacterium]
MELSIIIITLNEEANLPRLLSDLEQQSFSGFEIIHVDSRSDDATVGASRSWSQKFEHYSIVEMSERGVSLGRNVGASHARGRRLLFLDADSRLPRTFLANSMGELKRRELQLGIVCMSGAELPWHYRLGFGLFNAGIWISSKFFPTAIGACLFSTPELHQCIGGFDEQLTLCEDCDYALRSFRNNRGGVGVLNDKFRFDARRLVQDGLLTTGLIYLEANARRLLLGELRNNEIPYEFGHYRR